MAWRPTFLAALEARARTPIYILEVLEVFHEPGAGFSISSHTGFGAERVGIGAVRGSPRVNVQGATLSPRGWTSTIGAFSLGIVGDIEELLAHVTRGTIVTLKAGFDGMHLSDFERIAVGQVRNLRGRAPMWTLECHDIMQAVRQRLETGDGLNELFAGIGNTTTLAADYTAGDTTLQVASTSVFNRETGAKGALKIEPSSGDPFYLTYTGTATGPVRFTGVSASGVLGSAAAAAATGDTVTEIAWLEGHPLDIIRKLLCSRDGTNGDYDVLPTGWGLGISDNLIDHDDIDRYESEVVVVSSGTYTWTIGAEALLEDAYTTLSDLLADAGLFLTVRQGSLTVRAGQNTLTAAYVPGISITEADIAAVLEYEAYDYSQSPEYGYVKVYYNGGTNNVISTLETAATLPVRRILDYDLTDRIYTSDPYMAQEVRDRVGESATRVPERLVLQCAGLRLAQLAPGDIVPLTTTRTHSRRDGAAGWTDRRSKVVEISPDWDGGTVRVGLLVYPETGEEFA